MQVWAIIVDSFREAMDRKLFWIMLVISTVIALGMACVGFDEKGISIFFGAARVDPPDFAEKMPEVRRYVGALVVSFILDTWIGWVGIILGLVATSSAFPSMLASGTVDVVLAKPMSRIKIFFAKYLGSLAFMFCQTAFFILLTWLIMGLRLKFWSWAYLWTIPLMILLFSYVYCVAVLFAVLWRSASSSLAMALAAWVVFIIPQAAYSRTVTNPFFDSKPVWKSLILAAHTVVPKTGDIPMIGAKLMDAAPVLEIFMLLSKSADPKAYEQQAQDMKTAKNAEKRIMEDLNIAKSIGTSLGFEMVVLLIAAWKFHRRDF